MFDLIGDIHGHADKLIALLEKLEYKFSNGYYSHPSRKVIFIGDYIDRGPQIIKTLSIVKAMVDTENAIALMGNHEYNALCFHIEEREGGHLRKHLIKNILQHYETLKQFQNKQKEYENYLEWFKTLPLFFETENFRAVHACWDYDNICLLKNVLIDNKLNDELIYKSAIKDPTLYKAIDIVLKGKEIPLPDDITFTDKDGTHRKEIRTKWWINPVKSNYHNLSVEPIASLPHTPIDPRCLSSNYYTHNDKPVFFGHYWLKGNPSLYGDNICCLDYSVAKHGYLTAYRFDGEVKLSNSKFVFV